MSRDLLNFMFSVGQDDSVAWIASYTGNVDRVAPFSNGDLALVGNPNMVYMARITFGGTIVWDIQQEVSGLTVSNTTPFGIMVSDDDTEVCAFGRMDTQTSNQDYAFQYIRDGGDGTNVSSLHLRNASDETEPVGEGDCYGNDFTFQVCDDGAVTAVMNIYTVGQTNIDLDQRQGAQDQDSGSAVNVNGWRIGCFATRFCVASNTALQFSFTSPSGDARGAALDSSNNAYLGFNNGNYAYIYKYNSSGVLQWRRRYDVDTDNGDLDLATLQIDNDDNLTAILVNTLGGDTYTNDYSILAEIDVSDGSIISHYAFRKTADDAAVALYKGKVHGLSKMYGDRITSHLVHLPTPSLSTIEGVHGSFTFFQDANLADQADTTYTPATYSPGAGGVVTTSGGVTTETPQVVTTTLDFNIIP